MLLGQIWSQKSMVYICILYNVHSYIYPLVLERSYWKWPIEIVDLPIKDGDFPVRKLLVYQRLNPISSHQNHHS